MIRRSIQVCRQCPNFNRDMTAKRSHYQCVEPLVLSVARQNAKSLMLWQHLRTARGRKTLAKAMVAPIQRQMFGVSSIVTNAPVYKKANSIQKMYRNLHMQCSRYVFERLKLPDCCGMTMEHAVMLQRKKKKMKV